MAAVLTKPITMDELLAMPEDGMDRWLIRGELREKPLSRRNYVHASVSARVTHQLMLWNESRPAERGMVLVGDAGVRLEAEPDTVFGIDVVYISAQAISRLKRDSRVIEEPPTLAVEILSPSNTKEEIDEKIEALLDAGVPLIWIVDPRRLTVTVYRPDVRPQLFNDEQDLSGEPHLPGFRVPVSRFFS